MKASVLNKGDNINWKVEFVLGYIFLGEQNEPKKVYNLMEIIRTVR